MDERIVRVDLSDGPAVFIPKPGTAAEAIVDRASGIVGTATPNGSHVLVDYEGNRYSAANIVTWADRVARAWDRHHTKYPTIARSLLHRSEVICVGYYRPAARRVAIGGGWRKEIAKWLAIDEAALEDELACSEQAAIR